ncbi:MAG: flagellar protein FliT [Nitrosomonadales bacterium]|nr:flagellar protein FliT [Nitrosomonadales bacterium]
MTSALENFEYLSGITGQMRSAAEQGEWDHLVELEEQCSQRVKVMQTLPPQPPTDEEIRQKKVALIKRILADDAEIRNKTEVWMHQLQRIMQSSSSERRLQQAYSAGQ